MTSDFGPMTVCGHQQNRLFRAREPLVLASASPRRQKLLRSLGLAFEIVPSSIDEQGLASGSPYVLVTRSAIHKALTVALSYPACWVLAADTIVVLEGRVFGKPADPAEAAAMLRQLGGREHQVYTGICLQHLSRHHRSTQVVTTRVQFKRLTDAEIRAYVATGEPLDKAGAYGIQGMGAYLVRALHGSYTNVVGLPLCETVELLTGQGIIETC